MRISIFGLGYVGTVSAGCLAAEGHKVIGVDTNKVKVNLINKGISPIIEKDIGEIINRVVKEGKLHATLSVKKAIMDSELSLICVGTPSQPNGSLDLTYVRRVCEQIGKVLRDKNTFHVVVVRSTMLPGSMRKVVIPILEEFSEKKAGTDFGVCINPEFLREGSAVYDFYNPPKIVIGEIDQKSGDVLVEIYKKLNAPIFRTTLEVAEMVKYVDNAWHALKVVFANEIGSICKELGIDSHEVMNIFCKDTKLNISPSYLKPGFTFGGSCLPKDVRALNYKAKILDLELPILENILRSNRKHIERTLNLIFKQNKRKIGILGFSFKEGTDDLRESPMIEIIERLIGKGYDLILYDRNVNIANLIGANKDYILNKIPHISKLMTNSIENVLEYGEIIIIGNNDPEFKKIFSKLKKGQKVIDLARISEKIKGLDSYEGICW